ncbi:Malic enzyme-like protein [Frankia sp. Hr75.2]|nr:Malic enzyme-like protein [Frankia sp. Hr75.2]
MLTPGSARANPAYSIRIRVPRSALVTVTAIIADAPGAVLCHADEPDPTGARRIILDADGSSTLTWLTRTLRGRLGADLLGAEDLAFRAAATGKLAQRVGVATGTGHDLALLDADADRRIIRHLAAHPRHTDRYTGRARRVALLTDASAVLDFEQLTSAAALPALESQAVHLHQATGLDVFPLPIAATGAAELATAIGLLAPGFAATVLVHTHIRHVNAVRAALTSAPYLLLDTVNDGLAIGVAAAALTHLRARAIDPHHARVVLIDPPRGGDLAGLLVAARIGDLTLYDPVAYGIEPLHRLAPDIDLIIDLLGLAAPPVGIPVLHSRPETPPALAAATTGPRPLHALPGLLSAAVTTQQPITLAARVAAVHTLTAHTPSGQLMPPLDHPRLTPAIAAAATHALTAHE